LSWLAIAAGLTVILVAEAVVLILVLRAMANGWPHPRERKRGGR
jgi:hypothetical protein